MIEPITNKDVNIFRKQLKNGPMQHHEEISEFLNIAIEHTPQKDEIIFIEIGLFRGGNFVFIGNMLSKIYPNIYGIGIDLPGIKKYAGKSGINPEEEIKKINPLFRYKIIIGNSQEQNIINKVKILLNNRKVDILFIDGDHSYNGCMSDFKNYSPMVRKNGIIGFHDLGENRFDIKTKVWPEIKSKYNRHWELVKQPGHYGIGLIVKE